MAGALVQAVETPVARGTTRVIDVPEIRRLAAELAPRP